MLGDLVRHDLEHDGAKGVSSWSGAPLGVVEAFFCLGFLDHVAPYDKALSPVEVGLEQVDCAEFV